MRGPGSSTFDMFLRDSCHLEMQFSSGHMHVNLRLDFIEPWSAAISAFSALRPFGQGTVEFQTNGAFDYW